jgi:hypothetical protein
MKKQIVLSLLLAGVLYAQSIDDDFDEFDESSTPISNETSEAMEGFDDDGSSELSEERTGFIEGLTGKLTQQLSYAYSAKTPHDNVNSVKSSLFLDYEHKFENGWKLKTNAKYYYDAIYDLRDEKYSKDERKENHHELALFDAYVEGSLSDSLDVKIGRQVVVWGRSDTIRITDVLNPIDNRKPAMVDIEDLRLPVGMVKFDYFIGDWRITPIAIVEQRFSKNPPFGSAFNPMNDPRIAEEKTDDVTYALSVGGEFSGWDVNVYATKLYADAGYVKQQSTPILSHEKVTMVGTAFNLLWGAWLFKSEVAYFDDLHYSSTKEKSLSRTDGLLGFEYKGFADTLVSYDVALRHFNHYDSRLSHERVPLEKETYQHALRVSADFMNATLTANYLISLYGKALDEGGFQRAWVKYELAQGVNFNVGLVDYIGGSVLFDSIKKNDMIFTDISYSF